MEGLVEILCIVNRSVFLKIMTGTIVACMNIKHVPDRK
jgi:hypothetical protein